MKRKFVYLLNAFYWITYSVVIVIILLASGIVEKPSIQVNMIRFITVAFIVIPSIVSFYSSYFFLFPNFIKTRKLPVLMLLVLLISIVSSILGLSLTSLLLGDQFTFQKNIDIFTVKFVIALLISLLNIVSGFIIKGFISWYADLKIKEELQEKAHVMELSLIESKLDPHFLFNTINNIDVLVLRDSQKASDYLNKLSSILRFILYESKGREIRLTEEIDYIMKYIELQKIRTSNEKFVTIDIKDEHRHSFIHPMTFIPFIENAFKHCTNKKIENAIQITILVLEHQVHFKCINKFPFSPKTTNKGIGNELIIKRLQLLYPNRHKLETAKNMDTYTVSLKIEL